MSNKLLFNAALYVLLFLIVFFLSAILFSKVILKGETVTVPDLTGKTLTVAKADLAKKDLLAVQDGSEFSDRWEKGAILRQDPAPGSRIRVTQVVRVVLSSGSQTVVVPDILGKDLETAARLLSEAGLSRGKSTQIHTAKYAAGRIIAQIPGPESIVERNSPVGLLISQGDLEDRYLMPELLYRRADRVIARLKELDFRIADIHYVYYPYQRSGIIVGQSPLPGYRIQKRNQITLEVSR
jgi:serine/threonine-protein kinase